LPYAPVLVVDQCEEVFTLARTDEDRASGRLGLQALRETVGAPGDYKVIVSLRTEYHRRLVDHLRRSVRDLGGVREYLLTDFARVALAGALRRPPSAVPIPHTREIPLQKYHFRFEDGVPEELAERALAYTTNRQDSVLPLVQVICTQLYERVRGRADGV